MNLVAKCGVRQHVGLCPDSSAILTQDLHFRVRYGHSLPHVTQCSSAHEWRDSFGILGESVLCCKEFFDLDVGRFVRPLGFSIPNGRICVALQWCVCVMWHGFDFFTSSLQQNQRTKMMWFVRIGLWRHSAFAHVRIRRLCDTFNGSARQHLHHGAMTGCNNAAAS